MTIQQNVKNVSKNYSIQVHLQKRLLFATKHVLSRCENSSQNLWYLKTSTSHTYKTDRKGYWQLFYTCDNSTEY